MRKCKFMVRLFIMTIICMAGVLGSAVADEPLWLKSYDGGFSPGLVNYNGVTTSDNVLGRGEEARDIQQTADGGYIILALKQARF